MFAKINTKNQLTLPKRAIKALGNPSHFRMEIEAGRLVLTPSHRGSAAVVRRKLQVFNLLESYVADAVVWARDNK